MQILYSIASPLSLTRFLDVDWIGMFQSEFWFYYSLRQYILNDYGQAEVAVLTISFQIMTLLVGN